MDLTTLTDGLEQVLPLAFYDRDPVQVARALLGKRLVCSHSTGRVVGRIVETEAYLAADDPASHAYRGPTQRNAPMFGPPGRSYVYALHRSHCLNVVTEAEGVPSAVLLRAVEPMCGLGLMHQRRRTSDPVNLTSGPGKLCQAFAIDRTLTNWDLTAGNRLWIADAHDDAEADVAVSVRIGVTSARDLPLRFYLRTSRFISRKPPRASAANGA